MPSLCPVTEVKRFNSHNIMFAIGAIFQNIFIPWNIISLVFFSKNLQYRVTSYTPPCIYANVKRDLSIVRVYSSVHWTSHFVQGTRKTMIV